MIFILISIISSSVFPALGLPVCPYPLAEDIYPCVCNVDEEFRLLLTCEISQTFYQKDLDRIANAFDYNNNIFQLDIHSNYQYTEVFDAQLNSSNIGKLNITNFSLVKTQIRSKLFGEGAFDGSFGSIQNITIADNYLYHGSINFGANVFPSACLTLKYLTLGQMSELSPSSFINAPNLEDIVLSDMTIDRIPEFVFSAMPNIKTITIESTKLTGIDPNAFFDLGNLETVNINTPSLDLIDTEAFHSLPNLKALDFGSANIKNIEKEAFKDLRSLSSLSITHSEITRLDRIFSNLEQLMSFSLQNSHLVNISEDAFDGVPNLNYLDLTHNSGLHHDGIGASLHGLADPYVKIILNNTQVKSLNEFVFRPLVETFAFDEDSSGFIAVDQVTLNCGCDVKWLLDDFPLNIDVFMSARCVGGGSGLGDVDPELLKVMCPPA